MRVALGVFSFFLALAGLGMAIAYPWAVDNISGNEIGKWRVYEAGGDFKPVEVLLAAPEAPVKASVDLVAKAGFRPDVEKVVMTLVVLEDGARELDRAFTFASVTPRTLNPQSGLVAYRALPIVINPVDGARYRFDFGPGDNPPDDFVSVDLTLTAAVFDLDPRAIPVGYVLTAVGLAGFALSFRRRKPVNPNQKPPTPRWGRDV